MSDAIVIAHNHEQYCGICQPLFMVNKYQSRTWLDQLLVHFLSAVSSTRKEWWLEDWRRENEPDRWKGDGCVLKVLEIWGRDECIVFCPQKCTRWIYLRVLGGTWKTARRGCFGKGWGRQDEGLWVPWRHAEEGDLHIEREGNEGSLLLTCTQDLISCWRQTRNIQEKKKT